MGSSPLQGLENCLREIPVPRSQPAWSWSSAGDRVPRRAEPKNWTADKEGKVQLPRCLGVGKALVSWCPGHCLSQPRAGSHPP